VIFNSEDKMKRDEIIIKVKQALKEILLIDKIPDTAKQEDCLDEV